MTSTSTPVSTSDPALAELRLRTRPEHDRIEALLQLTEPMPLARYAAIVAGFHAFLHAWEPRVHAALPLALQPWYAARRRAGFTSADLDWLRTQAGQPLPAADAAPAAALPLGDAAQVFGSLYVIEGSALGGQVITPRLRDALGLAPGAGASYFHGFGSDTGAQWRDFRITAAREIGTAPEAVARACESARRTFGALVEIFTPLVDEAPQAASALR